MPHPYEQHQKSAVEIARLERLGTMYNRIPEYVAFGVPKKLLGPLLVQHEIDAKSAKQRRDFTGARRAERVCVQASEALDALGDSNTERLARVRACDPSFFSTDSDEYVLGEVCAMTAEDMAWLKDGYEAARAKIAHGAPLADIQKHKTSFAYDDICVLRGEAA
jgi:hypothetical protein